MRKGRKIILNLETTKRCLFAITQRAAMIVIYLEQIVPLSQWITPKMRILFLH